jgi:hypothetical protein
MECLSRNASSTVSPGQEATWAVTSKDIGAGLPKPLRAHTMSPCSPDGRHESTGFSVYPAGFQSYFSLILPLPQSQLRRHLRFLLLNSVGT